MTKRVLLVGMNSFDSGKTQIAIRLSRLLSEEGHSVEYFKPVSGHNYWFNHEHTKTCMQNGVLASMDAMRVRKVLNPKSPLELANPVHSLFVPMRLEKPLQNLTNTLGLAGASSVLTMERFSRPDASEIDTTVLVAQKLVEEERLIIKQEEVGMLTRGAGILSVNSLEEVQEYERLNFENHVTESFAEVERFADIVIVEGFNDAAWPWDGLENVDTVLLISPAHIFTYDPERFRKAAYLMNRGNLPIREVTFGRISDLLKPIYRGEIRPETEITTEDLEQLGISFRTGKND
jgi:predicted P-loop ATPase/GTPase